MTTTEKKEFVTTLINMVRDDILKKVDAMPETWDGVELREYTKDRYTECCYFTGLKGKRKRDYKNELIINGRL